MSLEQKQSRINGLEKLDTPSLQRPEVKKEPLSIQLEYLLPEFASKIRKRFEEMGRNPEVIPPGEMVKAYKFKNGIFPLDEHVSPELATAIAKKFYRMKMIQSQKESSDA